IPFISYSHGNCTCGAVRLKGLEHPGLSVSSGDAQHLREEPALVAPLSPCYPFECFERFRWDRQRDHLSSSSRHSITEYNTPARGRAYPPAKLPTAPGR